MKTWNGGYDECWIIELYFFSSFFALFSPPLINSNEYRWWFVCDYPCVSDSTRQTRHRFGFYWCPRARDKACILIFHRVDEHVACLLYGPLGPVSTKNALRCCCLFFQLIVDMPCFHSLNVALNAVHCGVNVLFPSLVLGVDLWSSACFVQGEHLVIWGL